MFAKAIKSTPVFNRPDLERVFSLPLKLCEKNLLHASEMVALKNTLFEVVRDFGDVIEVRTKEYLVDYPLYVHRSFVEESNSIDRERSLPSKEAILNALLSFEGAAYVWGGNVSGGISELLDLYPPGKILSDLEKSIWQFQGVDCSGLLYAATAGFTERNTSMLFDFGETVSGDDFEPLDLLLWKGHVVILLSDSETIESRAMRGVFRTPLKERLEQIRVEVGDAFVHKRWYPHYSSK